MKRDQLPFINNKEISGVGQVVEFKAGSHIYTHTHTQRRDEPGVGYLRKPVICGP